MVQGDPEAHDDLYVRMWGDAYRDHPDFQAWITKVKADPARGLRSFKNDLSDRLHEQRGQRKSERKGW